MARGNLQRCLRLRDTVRQVLDLCFKLIEQTGEVEATAGAAVGFGLILVAMLVYGCITS